MRNVKPGLLVAATLCALALSACNSNKDAAPAAAKAEDGPAAVTVNGTVISEATVDRVLKQRMGGAPAGMPVPPEARKAIIDGLVMQTVVAQEAAKQGLDKAPEFLAQMELARSSVLANAYVADYMKKNPVTDEALKAEYDRLNAQNGEAEYKARHILVATEAEAKDIIAKLNKAPASFEKLAKEKSKDPGSKGNGGDLGWFEPGRMVPEFGAALTKLEKGKFTQEPVKSQFGYHVILLEDSRKVEPPPLDSVKPQLSQELQQKALRTHLESLKTAAKVDVAAAAAASAPAPAPAPASAASK